MGLLLLYLLKANASLLGWWALYRLLLQRFTFYGWNRVYLLVGLLFSLLYPLVDLTVFADRYPTYSLPISQMAEQLPFVKNQSLPQALQKGLILHYVYAAGVLAMSLRTISQLGVIRRVWRSSQPLDVDTYQVRLLAEPMAPFSFGRYVFIPAGMVTDPDLASILAHERVHAQQGHTVDLLLAQVFSVFFWFNPCSYWLSNVIRQNLEFLTDRTVLDQGVNRKAYQYSLLRQSVAIFPPTLGSHFLPIDLKTRIQQINRATTSPVWRPLYGVVVLLLLGTCGGWSVFQTYVANHYAFYWQMNDPAFIQLQSRAASPALQQELDSVRGYYQSDAWQQQQRAFEAQMNDSEFIRLQQKASR